MSAAFRPGQRVRVRAKPEEEGAVTDLHASDGGFVYDVYFSRFHKASFPEHQLVSADEDGDGSPVGLLRLWRFAAIDDFRSFLTLERLQHPLASTVYSYLASRTELLPYQFKPVLKLLDNPYSRLLIADEVGLGKTIEAGIIMTELNARSPLTRVLVVCPSALLEKWFSELLERFGLEFSILRGSANVIRTIEDAASSPGRPYFLIVSLETLRRDETMDALKEHGLDFDVVVVDEAHHMRNSWTKAHDLGNYLSAVADTMIFLTATPLNLGQEDFFELLHILVPEEFEDFGSFAAQIEPNRYLNAALAAIRAVPPDLSVAMRELGQIRSTRIRSDPRFQEATATLHTGQGGGLAREQSVVLQRSLTELNTLSHIFTRTRKREVQTLFPIRRADPVPVEFTLEEREFYDAVSAWIRLANQRHGAGIATFVLVNYQRQLASCLRAAGERLERTVLRGVLELRPGEVDDYDEEDIDIDLDIDPDAVDPVTVELDEDEVSSASRLRRAWHRVQRDSVDSKYEAFREALQKLLAAGTRKVLVFSFFIGTIDYLERRLREEGLDGTGIRVLKLYGRTAPSDRPGVVEAFAEAEEPVVLLSSEVGSEGLDFQFCSAMFNYDLPWNPMRVEQRIGRLDRYGQQAKAIQILNLVVPDTIEGRIFYRLYDRINIFREAIGDLEAILADRSLERDILRLKREVVFGELTPEEERDRSELIARAIVLKQDELQRWEEQSRQFIGQDEVFAERFNDISTGHRYIAPDEVRALVASFLQHEVPNVKIADVPDRPGVVRFTGRGLGDLHEAMREHLIKDSRTVRNDWAQASSLTGDEPREATFDAREAVTDRRLEFITVRHPLVRTVIARMSGRTELLPTGAATVAAVDGARPGRHLFFLFRAEVVGIKSEIDFVAVAVTEGGDVDEALSTRLPAELATADPWDAQPADWLRQEVVDRAESAAYSYIEAWRARREAEGQRFADALVTAQLESLHLGHERRVARVEARAAVASHPNLLRMLRGERRNIDRRYENKRAEIDAKRRVAVGLDLMAAGVVHVGEAT